ncbi:MAG: CotH kinase family protein [Lachnospiraceae bacterium]|nr:CotH kinase family protein [Lachnospiraceae bacterium]
MKNKIIVLCIVMSFLITACNSSPENEDVNQIRLNTTLKPTTENQADMVNTSFGEIKDKSLSEEEIALYKELFDINSTISIKIDISDTELGKIQQDYQKYDKNGAKSPIYRIADKVTITINGKDHVIEEVGVRMKGNTSRRSFYDKGNDKIYNMVNLKLSFEETFDDKDYYGNDAKVWSDNSKKEEREKRTFASLNALEVKWNICKDETYVREYYVHEMFRENGVLAARCNIASLDLGRTHMGVFKIYEPIDKKFLKKYLDEEYLGGDLYKCMWTNNGCDYTLMNSIGIEEKETGARYNFNLKTNKKTSDNENLKYLLYVLDSGNKDEATFESVVDKNYWINFAAVSYFAADPDDMRNNFNNHYVYFLGGTNKAIFIPYDNDRVIGAIEGFNPTGDGLVNVSPYSQYAQGAKNMQSNNLFNWTVARGGLYVEEYRDKLLEICNGKWLTTENYEPYYNMAKSHYASLVNPDSKMDNVDNDELAFTDSLDSGKKNIAISEFFKSIKNTCTTKIDDYVEK